MKSLRFIPGLIALALSFLAVSCHSELKESEGSIVVTVFDEENNRPIPGATVTLRTNGDSSPVDNDGYHRFEGVLPGSHTVVAVASGYRQDEKNVTVNAGREVKAAFRLKTAVSALSFTPANLLEINEKEKTFSITNAGGKEAYVSIKIPDDTKWIESVSPNEVTLKTDESTQIKVTLDREKIYSADPVETKLDIKCEGHSTFYTIRAISSIKNPTIEIGKIESHVTEALINVNLVKGTHAVTEYGVCYSASNQVPNLENDLRAVGTQNANQVQLKDLQPGTQYFIRAYAKTQYVTVYSSGSSFTTTKDIGSVEGHVFHKVKTETPISNAVVKISDGKGYEKTTNTNSDGSYHFVEVPNGTFKVTASKEGYNEDEKTVTVNQNKQDLDLFLLPTANAFEVDSPSLDFNENNGSQNFKVKNIGGSSINIIVEKVSSEDIDWIKTINPASSFSLDTGHDRTVTLIADMSLITDVIPHEALIKVSSPAVSDPVYVKLTAQRLSARVPKIILGNIQDKDITSNSVFVTGEITDIGSHIVDSYGVLYSTDREKLKTEQAERLILGSADAPKSDIKVTLPALKSGTQYYLCLFAHNNVGYGYSQDLSFETKNDLGSVSGIVRDKYSSEPLSGVLIQCERTMGTVTNSDGTYLLENVPVGANVISASLNGYTTVSQNVSVQKDKTSENVNFTMVMENAYLVMEPSEVDFGRDGSFRDVTIRNVGGKTVAFNLDSKPDWITIDPSTANLSPGTSRTLTFIANRDKIKTSGLKSDEVSFSAEGANHPSVKVKIDVGDVARPSVEITRIENTGFNDATVVANLTSLGSHNVIRHGFCWSSKKPYPKIEDGNFIDLGQTDNTGPYSELLTGLDENTRYYVVAFAENAIGVSYSREQLSFQTKNNAGKVSGKVKHSVTERPITEAVVTIVGTNFMTKTDSEGNYSIEGIPPGQVKVRAEANGFESFEKNINISFSNPQTADFSLIPDHQELELSAVSLNFGSNPSDNMMQFTLRNIGKSAINYAISYDSDWIVSATPSSASIPVGVPKEITVTIDRDKVTAKGAYSTVLQIDADDRQHRIDVRMEIPVPAKPEVSIKDIDKNKVNYNSALIKGELKSVGSHLVSSYGICWSTNENPTMNDSHVDLGATGAPVNIEKTITGLKIATKYYVRIYARNAIGTVYSNQIFFTTPRTDTGSQNGGGEGSDFDNNEW